MNLVNYLKACQFRFAFSERNYLLQLWQTVKARVEDISPFAEFTAYFLPKGGLNSFSILHNLIETLHLQGPTAIIHQVCQSQPSHRWILAAALPSLTALRLPPGFHGMQSAVLHVLNSYSKFYGDPISAFQSYLLSMLSVTLNSRCEEPWSVQVVSN